MNRTVLMLSAGVFVVYALLVYLIGFTGFAAMSIHFSRLVVSFAVLLLYIPTIKIIFIEVPAPRRDYLIAGIICTWLSAVGFSIWNAFGKVFGVDTSVFTSPVAGFFSLLLLSGGALHVIAPQLTHGLTRREALMLGALFAIVIVFILPMVGSTWPCAPVFRHWLDDFVPACRVPVTLQ